MKKLVGAGVLLMAAFGTSAQDADMTITKLATDSATKAQFSAMVKGHQLPRWVVKGGMTSPAKTVKLAGTEYQVLQACKPHDCGTQRIAVIYAPGKAMAGVYSTVKESEGTENLTWLVVPDDLSIDGKTVLYSALTGSLENHPDAFNYQ